MSEGGGEAGDGGGGAVGGGVKVTATHDCTECDFCHLLRLLVTEGSPTCCCLGSGRVPLAFVGMVSWWCVCVCVLILTSPACSTSSHCLAANG